MSTPPRGRWCSEKCVVLSPFLSLKLPAARVSALTSVRIKKSVDLSVNLLRVPLLGPCLC